MSFRRMRRTRCDRFSAVLLLRLNGRSPGLAAVCAGNKAVRAGVAQLVEHLICNQRVGGSSPFASSSP